MIKAAAIQKNGIWYAAKRHDLVFYSYGRLVNLRGGEQGFITDKFEFVDRYQAAKIAFECGQIKKEVKMLMSEDLIRDDPNYYKEKANAHNRKSRAAV